MNTIFYATNSSVLRGRMIFEYNKATNARMYFDIYSCIRGVV